MFILSAGIVHTNTPDNFHPGTCHVSYIVCVRNDAAAHTIFPLFDTRCTRLGKSPISVEPRGGIVTDGSLGPCDVLTDGLLIPCQ